MLFDHLTGSVIHIDDKSFCQFFKARGHTSTTLDGVLDFIKSIDRNTAMQPSSAKLCSVRIPLVLSLYLSIEHIQRVFYKNVKNLGQDAST